MNMRSFLRLPILSLLLLIFSLSVLRIAQADVANGVVLKIGTWNTFDFGGKFGGDFKVDDNTILTAMTATIAQYDIVFLQEIADKASSYQCGNQATIPAFKNLCSSKYLGGPRYRYQCQNIPVIAEDTGNCEAYGVVYKPGLIQSVAIQYTGDPNTAPYITPGSIKRPPMQAVITLRGGKQIVIYDIHTSPSNGVSSELQTFNNALNTTYNNTYPQNVIALGDFNAGCTYLKGGFTGYNGGLCSQTPSQPPNTMFTMPATPPSTTAYAWQYIIPDTVITNFPNSAAQNPSQCAYDRIMLTQGTTSNYAYLNNCTYSAETQQGSTCSLAYAYQNSSCLQNTVPTDPGHQGYPYGYQFNQVTAASGKALSDHQLAWSQLTFGGISPTNPEGRIKGVFKIYGTTGDDIYFKGRKFLPNTTLYAYISMPIAKNQQRVAFTPLSGPAEVRTDANGDIEPTLLSNAVNFTAGQQYDILLTFTQDDVYYKATDTYEAFTVVRAPNSQSPQIWVAQTNSANANAEETRVFKKQKTDQVVQGINFTPGAQVSVKARNYVSGNTISLNTYSETVGADGSFTLNNLAEIDPAGGYNVFFDTQNNGVYDPATDTIDYPNQIGFMVTENAEGDNDVVTLDDQGKEREDFDPATANNIYVLAKNLPNQTVDVYVVSDQLVQAMFPDWDGDWSNPILDGMDLELVSVPVFPDDPQTRAQTVQVPYSGELFTDAWENPSDKVGSASASTQNDFFTLYGSNFNVVINVDKSAKYSVTNDKVDTHAVNLILNWLSSHDTLDSTSTGSEATAAITQYQELLNGKLNLTTPLALTGQFDEATQQASEEYICEPYLTKDMSDLLAQDAQVGFSLSLAQEYWANEQYTGNRYHYADVSMDGSAINNQGYACEHSNNLTANNLTANNSQTFNMVAKQNATLGTVSLASSSSVTVEAQNTALTGSVDISNNGYLLLLPVGAAIGTAALCTATTGGATLPFCVKVGHYAGLASSVLLHAGAAIYISNVSNLVN